MDTNIHINSTNRIDMINSILVKESLMFTISVKYRDNESKIETYELLKHYWTDRFKNNYSVIAYIINNRIRNPDLVNNPTDTLSLE